MCYHGHVAWTHPFSSSVPPLLEQPITGKVSDWLLTSLRNGKHVYFLPIRMLNNSRSGRLYLTATVVMVHHLKLMDHEANE